jgi:hypothetical protein
MTWQKPSADLTSRLKSKAHDAALSRAILAARAQADLPESQKQSLEQIAGGHQVSPETLRCRLAGTKSRTEARQAQQALSVSQEEVLTGWIKYCGFQGIPLSKSAIQKQAELIAGRKIGCNWVAQFALRHQDLAPKWTRKLEACRAQALNKSNVQGFYDTYQQLREQYSIPDEMVWNADEKGAALNENQCIRALVDRDQKTVHRIGSSNCEMVTIIECVSAAGGALQPMVIFKGQRLMSYWFEPGANPSGAMYVLPLQTCTENH